ncbi:hypothetical protein BJ912DRAFT_920512 [Pholiota molesta]|nr:hypothetical protein BJ912DRAFT_920512 [Pholiota molesta]
MALRAKRPDRTGPLNTRSMASRDLFRGFDSPREDGSIYLGGVNEGHGLDAELEKRLDDMDDNDDEFEPSELQGGLVFSEDEDEAGSDEGDDCYSIQPILRPDCEHNPRGLDHGSIGSQGRDGCPAHLVHLHTANAALCTAPLYAKTWTTVTTHVATVGHIVIFANDVNAEFYEKHVREMPHVRKDEVPHMVQMGRFCACTTALVSLITAPWLLSCDVLEENLWQCISNEWHQLIGHK